MTLLAAGCETTDLSGVAGKTTGSGPAVFIPSTASPGLSNAAALEQLMLERINRARLRPGDEAAHNGIAINEGLQNVVFDAHPRPAVSFNSLLAQSARLHADDMPENNCFAHEE